MKRRDVPGGVRFITFACYHRVLLLGNPPARDTFVRAMAEARGKFRLEIFAWVVMPDHAHLLLRPPPDTPLAPVLKSMKLAVSMRLVATMKRAADPMLAQIIQPNGCPRVWQPGGSFDRNTRDRAEFTKSVQYIHRNPVKRSLVERPEDWQWSSVRWWMGRREGEIPCDPPPGGTVAWQHWCGFV